MKVITEQSTHKGHSKANASHGKGPKVFACISLGTLAYMFGSMLVGYFIDQSISTPIGIFAALAVFVCVMKIPASNFYWRNTAFDSDSGDISLNNDTDPYSPGNPQSYYYRHYWDR